VRVIASSIRKGNIIEREDGQLYVVLTAESFHPGKGTPTTQIDMRRLSDGVKTTDRYKTTEQVERAFVEDSNFNYLYQDSDGYTFMNAETYDQVIVPADIIGSQTPYLQEGMTCIVSMFNGIPVAIQLPARVTLEIVETEPAMKGQTASSSYKPAKASNGVRIMVPPHIQTGTRVIVQTEDGSYVERAKD
jgi:elongation factor P